MMCFIHYISAIRRLKESEKTVAMLADGSEDSVPPMVLAQRDFIKKEIEFFKQECEEHFLILVCIGFAAFVIFCLCA